MEKQETARKDLKNFIKEEMNHRKYDKRWKDDAADW